MERKPTLGSLVTNGVICWWTTILLNQRSCGFLVGAHLRVRPNLGRHIGVALRGSIPKGLPLRICTSNWLEREISFRPAEWIDSHCVSNYPVSDRLRQPSPGWRVKLAAPESLNRKGRPYHRSKSGLREKSILDYFKSSIFLPLMVFSPVFKQ
jgi:hypothetical protein